MSDHYAPVHHLTTSDTPTHQTHNHGDLTTSTTSATGVNTSSSSSTQPINPPTPTPAYQTDTINPTTNPTSPPHNFPPRDNTTDLSKVDSNDAQARRASLAPTPNPTAPNGVGSITTSDADKSEIPPYSSVGSQNAPGKAGSVGENVLGAFGYGGSRVERPKEDQGLGEKIVNFLGA